VLNINEGETNKPPTYSEMADMQQSLTRNEMVARMLIPRRIPVQLKRLIEETPVADEVEEVRDSIKKVNGDLIDDFKLIDNLARTTSLGIKNRLNIQT
jgi:hypothetical protein